MTSVMDINEVSDSAATSIVATAPYTVNVTITGTADLLFHGWSFANHSARKGSKKTDDVESYVHRDEHGYVCLPGEYLRQSTIHAAKYRKDPRSPRKSGMDLFKAGVVSLTHLASLGTKTWEFEHKARVTVQRAGITRTRPAFKQGWSATVQLMVLVPEYITPMTLHETISDAGRLVGVGDFRPTFGRFAITRFELT